MLLFIKNIFVLSEAHFIVYKATNKLILKRESGQSEAKREREREETEQGKKRGKKKDRILKESRAQK